MGNDLQRGRTIDDTEEDIFGTEILEKVREWDPVELLDLNQQIDIHPRWKVRQGTWGLTQEGQ